MPVAPEADTNPEADTDSGPNRVNPPASPGRATVLIVGAFAAGVALTGWLRTELDRPLRGRLVAHETPVRAAAAGRFATWDAADADSTRHGEPLGAIENVALRARIERSREAVAGLGTGLLRARARVEVELGWRLQEIDSEILATELRTAELLKQRLDERLGDLAWSDFAVQFGEPRPAVVPVAIDADSRRHAVTRALLDRERARNAGEVVDAQLELCERRLGDLRELRARLPSDNATAHGLESFAADLETARFETANLEAEAATLVVRSPGYGTIDRVTASAGDEIRRGDVIAVVVDDARRAVELPVPSTLAGGFATGTPVRLVFPGGEKRTGRVASVPPRAVVRDRELDDPAAETFVLVRIEPTGKLWPAAPLGTSIEVRSGG